MRRAVIVPSSLVVLLASAPAWAGYTVSIIPKPDPPGHWRVLTQDDATSTSKCIGNPKTPLCAVETLQACFHRKKPGYCRTSIDPSLPAVPIYTPAVPDDALRYRIIAARRITDRKDLPIELRDRTDVWRRGDVLIVLDRHRCLNGVCDKYRGPYTTYVIRQNVAGWGVTVWSTPKSDQAQ